LPDSLSVAIRDVSQDVRTGRRLGIQIDGQQRFLSVGRVPDARAIRRHQAGCRLLVLESVVDVGKVDRVLRRPRDHRILEIGGNRLSPETGHRSAVIAPGEMGMEHDARPTPGRLANRFRVAPPLVADDDPERYAVDGEESPCVAGDIPWLLLDHQLVLGLGALERAVRVDDEGEVEQTGGARPLHRHDHRYPMPARQIAHTPQDALLRGLLRWRRHEVEFTVAWEVGFREADDHRVPRRGLSQEAPIVASPARSVISLVASIDTVFPRLTPPLPRPVMVAQPGRVIECLAPESPAP